MVHLRFLLLCAVTLTTQAFEGTPPIAHDDPNDMEDVPTDKTMDEILRDANENLSPEIGLIRTEYDLLLTPEQYKALHGTGADATSKRNAIKNTRLRWPNAKMIYNVVRGHFTKAQVFGMQKAMTEIEFYTCVTIDERDTEFNFVFIQNGNGCSSQLGRVSYSGQALYLSSNGCRYKGLYVHEMLHALGVIHEHQRPDRDDYLRIFLGNVQSGLESAFSKYSYSELTLNNVEYELASIMHYGVKAFSKNGQKTLEPKDISKEKYIGRVYQKGIAYTDVKNLNLMYGCASHCPNPNKCGANGHLDFNCNCICRDGTTDCDPDRKENVPANCQDTYFNKWDCKRWADQGECEANPNFMSTNCQRSCRKCGPKLTPGGECKDLHPRCKRFKVRGECDTNKQGMFVKCRKTCNLCNGIGAPVPETNCANKYSDSSCDGWAKSGECQVNPYWMVINCRKSCRSCNKPDCGNKYGNDGKCQGWAGSGECQNNPTWMLRNCKDACNACDFDI